MKNRKKIYITKGDFLHKGVILHQFFGICRVLYRDMFSNECKITYTLKEYLHKR